jgi:hypothetical protein
MALEGGTEGVFNPQDAFDELAASMDLPGEPGAVTPEDVRAQAEFQYLSRIVNMARGSQGGWDLLRRFIGERARKWADRCASINPEEDPVKRHGRQCFNAGAAFGLAMLAVSLSIPRLDRDLDRLLSPEAALRGIREEPEMDVI